MYVELHTASAFSFLQGASLPEALVDRAAELGYPAIALLDRDGVYGLPRFHKAAFAAGINPSVGAELTIERPGGPARSGESGSSAGSGMSGESGRTGGLEDTAPENADGYRNLCRLITRMKMRAPKGEGALQLDELEGCTSGLVALAGRAALDGRRHGVGGLLDRLVGLFGRDRVYVELQRHLRRDEERDNAALAALATAFGVPT
ncbi:MAG: error-prone DNA polymerase, partial [Acidobacteria bacterium]